LELVLSFLDLHVSLVLELFVIDFDLLLCLDLLSFMIECPLHFLLKAALLVLEDLDLRLMSLLQLLESLAMPAALPGQVLQFGSLTILRCLKCLAGILQVRLQKGYFITGLIG